MPHFNANIRPSARYTRIDGRKASQYVTRREPFKNSNGQLYGHWEGAGVPHSEGNGMRYVVYSYGIHWPLFIWDDLTQRWYGNTDKDSPTTSRHRTYAHPHVSPAAPVLPLPLEAMRLLAREGYRALVAARLDGVRLD